jgi:cell division protein FtsB
LRRRRSPALRFAGRVTALAIALLVVTLVVIQFARAIGENLTAAHELKTIRSDIAALRERRDEQEQELKRLRSAEGAVPEIHDRLRLVRPNEALIFVSPQPAAQPSDAP